MTVSTIISCDGDIACNEEIELDYDDTVNSAIKFHEWKFDKDDGSAHYCPFCADKFGK